jgi:hypothetical protein
MLFYRNFDKGPCVPLTGQATEIPNNVEFIAVLCAAQGENGTVTRFNEPKRKVVDMFPWVPTDGHAFLPAPSPTLPKLNVVLLGLNAVSHMNFLRTMPQTYLFLTQQLSARGMEGYASGSSQVLKHC